MTTSFPQTKTGLRLGLASAALASCLVMALSGLPARADDANPVLAKVNGSEIRQSDMAIAARYAGLVEDKKLARRIFARIEAEWERTGAALTLITGEADRLASNPALARSIAHRFPYLDPLNHLQVELMRRYRASRKNDPGLERVQSGIHISINGLAAGLRNTG